MVFVSTSRLGPSGLSGSLSVVASGAGGVCTVGFSTGSSSEGVWSSGVSRPVVENTSSGSGESVLANGSSNPMERVGGSASSTVDSSCEGRPGTSSDESASSIAWRTRSRSASRWSRCCSALSRRARLRALYRLATATRSLM